MRSSHRDQTYDYTKLSNNLFESFVYTHYLQRQIEIQLLYLAYRVSYNGF